MIKTSVIKIITLLVLLPLLMSCAKEGLDQTVPYAEVDFQFDIVNHDSKLNSGGEHLVFEKNRLASDRCGYSGLIVYNTGMMNDGVWQFYAFDRCCPNEKRQNVIVEIQSDGMTAVCSTCKTSYSLFSGGLRTDGVGTENLQRYRVRAESGNGKFRVTR